MVVSIDEEEDVEDVEEEDELVDGVGVGVGVEGVVVPGVEDIVDGLCADDGDSES